MSSDIRSVPDLKIARSSSFTDHGIV